MGVYVMLHLDPAGIESETWERCFDETVRLLRAHPSPLMGCDMTELFGTEVPVYTREIERDRGGPEWRWSVCGDLESLRYGELFELQRDLRDYPRSDLRTSEDILWFALDDEFEAGPVSVFSEKTQGEPYHFAMLGAAMVVESWFPRKAMVEGDIDLAQALRVQRWIQEVLGRQVPLPVRLDAPALLSRLAPRFSGFEQLEAFDRLFLGEHSDRATVAAVRHAVPPEDAEQWFVDELRESRGPLPTVRLMLAWLDAGGDLARLCELACFDARGPHCDPVHFGTLLADTWIGLPREAAAFLDAVREVGDEASWMRFLMGSVLLDDGKIGRPLEVHLKPAAIEASLRRAFGARAPEVIAAFGADTAAKKAELAEPADFPAFAARGRRLDEEDLVVLDSADHLTPRWRGELECMACIALQGFELLASMDVRVRKALENPEACRGTLAYLMQRGPALTESAWERIRTERDLHVLHLLIGLAAVPRSLETFANLRRAVFENDAVRRFVLRASRNRKLMARLTAQAEAELKRKPTSE